MLKIRGSLILFDVVRVEKERQIRRRKKSTSISYCGKIVIHILIVIFTLFPKFPFVRDFGILELI